MKYNYILGFTATVPGLPAVPPIVSGLISTRKITRLLLFILCTAILFYGTAVSHSYGVDVALLNSDASGVVLELQIGDLVIENKEFGSKNYHSISYGGSAFTSEIGKPQLPVSHAFLGVPSSASISVRIVDSQFTDLYGYTPPPVPERIQQTSSNGVDTLVGSFVEDRATYGRNAFYPLQNVAFTYEGYVRRQRVAVIELRPIQYNPATRLLRKYSRLIVRVDFSSGSGSSLTPGMSGSTLAGYQRPQKDKEFEKLYKGLLLNYDDARKWRKPRSTNMDKSLAPRSEATTEALKLFTRQSGIYRLDYPTLLGAGLDLAGVDPRTIKVQLSGNQVPIYVSGEADGRFDRGDYVEFFAARAHNIYTRWDVYRLTWGGVRGMRMAQKSGTPVAVSAREVTAFNSVERFEEDHLHHKLQNVRPDPRDPEAWFESRDHWFWKGIENGSSKTETTVEFPVYDMAQSLIRPSFKVELVGCTNFEHRALISVNGYKVEEALWSRQDIYSFDGQISANAMNEGVNELRITRIGTNPNDGESTDNYPYQVYLNWFEIGYVRKLLAVNDSLIFSAPEPKDPDANEVNKFTISGFLNDDVEIFQITGSNAVAKFKNVVMRKYSLDREGRDRIRAINAISGESTMSTVPNAAYRAIFEDQGGRVSRYMAVTPASVLTPERIELDTPSNLKDPSNQADHLIIAHPMFMDSANRLADFRSSVDGGSFRTRVVDVTDVYDEFNFGMVSPHAIKDFLKFAYNNWMEPAPAYVLIFGDATFDFLGIKEEFYEEPPELIGFIPTFYIHTGFGQTAADHWYSTIDGTDGFPDIYLGRIPVESVSEAETVVGKIIANESSGMLNGPWRKQIISIADDDSYAAGDEQFRAGLEEIWQSYTPAGYDTEKIYLKDVIQEVERNPLETRRPAEIVEGMIIDSIGNGAVIAQYAGHGGRHVWAHEIIFSIVDIEKMKETEIYPFMLVLSCYNGYFDLPGELSMAEGLLRADGRGIVAMLSATRLTYGSGNIALNKLMFDGIFKDKLLRLGQVTAISKTRLLINEGLTWLNQMQEYTLFGDPASWLNIADYEAYPELENAAAAPGGKLKTRAGQVVKSIGGQQGNFTGQLTATISLPDGSEISKSATVTNGSYPATSFDIPAGMKAGQGMLTFYGENATEIMIGGSKFTVSEPSIISIDYEFLADELQFYAEVSDDAGISGIKSVVLTWWSHSNWSKTDSPMSFDKQKNVYKLDKPLSSPSGIAFTYFVTVEDVDGNSIISERQTVTPSPRPDLTILLSSDGSGASISYGYSAQSQSPGINVQIQNTEAVEVSERVKIFAFSSHPDQNGDGKTDGVPAIGKGWVELEDWNSEGVALAFMETPPLSPGKHIVYVWVDPEISNSDDVVGELGELKENNNIAFQILDVTQALIRPARESQIQSSDDILHFSVPTGAVDKTEAMAVKTVQNVQQPINQPAVSFVPLPGGQQGGYQVLSVSESSEIEDLEFHSPASLEIKFDLASFSDKIKDEIGLGDIPNDQLGPEQREALERTLKEQVSNIAVHRWYESAGKWANIPSTPILDAGGSILRSIHNTIPSSQNAGTGSLQVASIQVDDDVTPAGEWVIFFVDSSQYELYFRDSGGNSQLQKLSDKTGSVEQLFYDDSATGGGTEIQFTVKQTDTRFQFGDVLRFATTESIDQNGLRAVQFSDIKRSKATDGIVRDISIDEDGDAPVDEWVILFLDPQRFHLQGRKTGVIQRNNEAYMGTVGEEFHDQDTGFRFTIVPGAADMKTGHKFSFRTVEIGKIQAFSESTGVFSLMLNKDSRPPNIQMDIANQNFADGDVVSSEPTIHALISDDNGVDILMRKLDISISRGGRDFVSAGEDDYVLHWDAASNDVPVNYWPGKLETGEYEVKLQAYDFNGNSNTATINFVVKGDFSIANNSLMNYPNPFERETDITFQLSSLADEAVIKIYTVSGRLIKTLEQSQVVNFVMVHWDGRDEDGKEVANGAYYYKIRLKSQGRKDLVEIGKMMKLK